MRKMVRGDLGFTLVEILAVTILIAVMAAGAALGINGQIKKGKIRAAQGQIGTFEQAIQLFELECGSYPSTLEDLIRKPTSVKCKGYPEEGYLDKKKGVAADPWNRDYHYQKPGSHNTTSFDLWSDGPDESSDADDITNWASEGADEE